jgi:hypothetical protein
VVGKDRSKDRNNKEVDKEIKEAKEEWAKEE